MATNETKRVPALRVEIDDDASGLTLTFANGERLTLGINDLADDVVRYATLHGLKQKLVDAAAISRDPETGRSATVADKYNAVKAVYDRLLAGQWTAPRGEGGTSATGLLFRALCRMYPGRAPETIREYLDRKNKKDQDSLRRNPRVAAIIEEIKAEAGPEDTSASDALLDELGEAE